MNSAKNHCARLHGESRKAKAGDRPVPAQRDDSRLVVVWDAPVRLFHWLAWASCWSGGLCHLSLDWMELHVRVGETLLALVICGLAGAVGSETARFRSFVASPAAALRHLRHLLRREPDVQVGHNAAGGWMVLLLLALLLVETLSGLYVNNDIADEGPLSEVVPVWLANAISTLHGLVWEVLLAAVALHVGAIGVYALAKGHHQTPPMLGGRKRLPARAAAPRIASPLLAVAMLGAGAAVAALIAGLL